MTAQELFDRVNLECHRRGYDINGPGRAWGLYAKWVQASAVWGADSPGALGFLLALVREAWDPSWGPYHSIRIWLHEDEAGVSIGNAHGWIHEFEGVSLGMPLVQSLEAAPHD